MNSALGGAGSLPWFHSTIIIRVNTKLMISIDNDISAISNRMKSDMQLFLSRCVEPVQINVRAVEERIFCVRMRWVKNFSLSKDRAGLIRTARLIEHDKAEISRMAFVHDIYNFEGNNDNERKNKRLCNKACLA